MRRFPWPDDVWQVSTAATKATRRGQAYAVRVRLEPGDALDDVWAALAATLTPGGHGLLDGGSVLTRRPDGDVDVVSGGEDCLDSLSWSLNGTLAEAAAAVRPEVGWRVVAEGNPPLRDRAS